MSLQGIIDEKKKDRRGFQDHAKESDRLRQKILLKDEEINDLRFVQISVHVITCTQLQ